MGWEDLSYHWQKSFEVAWESFKEGARPIGAIVINKKGEMVSTGKSAVFQEVTDGVISHNELAHAEVNALLKLDNRLHKKVNDYTLYTTLEPCPLCFSAFYMSGIRNLRYAAKDKYGGSTNLYHTTPYLSKKPIIIEGPVKEVEDLSVLLNVYYDLNLNYTKAFPVHELMEEDYPAAVKLARQWHTEGKLENASRMEIQDVLMMMIKEIQR